MCLASIVVPCDVRPWKPFTKKSLRRRERHFRTHKIVFCKETTKEGYPCTSQPGHQTHNHKSIKERLLWVEMSNTQPDARPVWDLMPLSIMIWEANCCKHQRCKIKCPWLVLNQVFCKVTGNLTVNTPLKMVTKFVMQIQIHYNSKAKILGQ